jgi:hypothetical protein
MAWIWEVVKVENVVRGTFLSLPRYLPPSVCDIKRSTLKAKIRRIMQCQFLNETGPPEISCGTRFCQTLAMAHKANRSSGEHCDIVHVRTPLHTRRR